MTTAKRTRCRTWRPQDSHVRSSGNSHAHSNADTDVCAHRREQADRERTGLLSGALLRTARLFPQAKLFEDLAQQATEGQITQRFENVSPLANLGPRSGARP